MANRRQRLADDAEALICGSLAHIPRRCPVSSCSSFEVDFSFFDFSHDADGATLYDKPWFVCRSCGSYFRLGVIPTIPCGVVILNPGILNSPDSSTDSSTLAVRDSGSDPAPEVTSEPSNARRSKRLEERRNKRLDDIYGAINAMDLDGGSSTAPSSAPTNDEGTPPNDDHHRPPVEHESDQPVTRGRSRKQAKPSQSPFM